MDRHFERSILPILTPLAVDAEHPFPFISGLGLNLAVRVTVRRQERFVRIKVPANRGRWVPVSGGGFVPLEQVIAANLGHVRPRDLPTIAESFAAGTPEGEAGRRLAMTVNEIRKRSREWSDAYARMV